MSNKKKAIADFLFAIQIACGIVFAGAYFIRSLYDVTGSSSAQFGLVVVYLLFHLALGVGANRVAPSRVTRQAVATYAIWWVMMTAVFLAVVLNPTYHWNEKDTATLVTAIVLTGVVVVGVIVSRIPWSDPMVKAFFAIAYKSVPQLLLAWKFMAEGASGTPGLSVFFGHVTIFIRLGLMYIMIREAGWDRNRVWLAVSETANELSWVVATIAWLTA